jgi:hypothetical protein
MYSSPDKILLRISMNNDDRLEKGVSPLAMSSEEFRKLGNELIGRIGDFLESLPSRPVTPAENQCFLRSSRSRKNKMACNALSTTPPLNNVQAPDVTIEPLKK